MKFLCGERLLRIVSFILLSAGFIVLILEVTFRIIYPVRFQSFINTSTHDWIHSAAFFDTQITRPSSTLGYEWVPNSRHAGYKINSLGMLDRERQRDKTAGIYRIICLGDSTTATSDYVRILEKLLNENKKISKFEVWNCAVPGYGAMQYCRSLQEKWLRYTPDMIIIGFCLNDFETTPIIVRENNTFVGYFPYKEILPKINPFLFRHSALYRFIVYRYLFKNSDDNFKVASSYLKEVKDILSAKNIRFLIVILGLAERFDNFASHYKINYAEIKRIVSEYDIPSLDVVPVFAEDSNPQGLRKDPGDELHFNEKGSRIVAGLISAYLKQNLKDN